MSEINCVRVMSEINFVRVVSNINIVRVSLVSEINFA